MSIAALDWAFKQPIGKSSQKFILVCLCNYANESGESYPSVSRLCFDSGQDDRTVRRNLNGLVKEGYIVKSGRFAGRAQQVPIYVISPYVTALTATPPKNGRGRKLTPPKNAADPSQKCTLTPPKNGSQTFFKPKEEPQSVVLQTKAEQEPDPERAERLRQLAAFAAHPRRQ